MKAKGLVGTQHINMRKQEDPSFMGLFSKNPRSELTRAFDKAA
jgi:hypothetical protein